MSASAYRLLGYLVWRGGKWYVRQRLPSLRAVARRGLLAVGALTAIVLVARRAKG
jgi:hypothetical protein